MVNKQEIKSAIDEATAKFKNCEDVSERKQWLSYLLESLEEDCGGQSVLEDTQELIEERVAVGSW